MIFDYLSLGKRVRFFRQRRGMSQMTLAENIDRATSYISYLENGQKCMSLPTFVSIANALNVSADDLLIDCIENNLKATTSEIAAIMSDCTEYERRIILELVITVKKTLRESRPYFSRQRD